MAEFFLPFSFEDDRGRFTNYTSQWLTALGRLRPGVDVRQARAELDTAAGEIRASVPDLPRDRRFYAERAGQLMPFLRKMAIPAFLLLLAITFLVLLTACANVANLMLARASARSQEIATRLAIGAGRGRLIRQLMTESLLLSLSGGVLGLALAEWAGRFIAGFHLPLPLPIDLSASVDYRVVLFSTALSAVAGIAFGLVPAFRATRPDLIASTRSDGGSLAGLRRFSLRNTLVVAQVGISGVLVICSGLFLRNLGEVRGIDSGMNVKNLALVQFDPSLSRYDEKQTQRLLLNILRDAESLPGARSASVTNLLPLSLASNINRVSAEGGEGAKSESAAILTVGPRYFETVGTPLLAGVDFPPAATTAPTVIVNQELARRLYPGQSAIGRRVSNAGHWARIAGVVGNSKYRMLQESEAMPILYEPILDSFAAQGTFGGITLIVQSAQDPAPLGNMIRQQILRRDPELVVNSVGTMAAHVREALFLPRLAASLFGLCGSMGLLIASIGVYGVISFAVARRQREIGIRMALGARASQIVRMVLRQGTAVVLAGIAIGVAGGFALARAAGSLLYGVSATDPVTFIAVPVILLGVGLLATAIPARRAAILDPNQTLGTR